MADKKEKRKFGAGIASWFKGIKSELKKIIWPAPNKIVKDTVIVLVTVAIVAAFLSLLDWVFHFGIEKLLG